MQPPPPPLKYMQLLPRWGWRVGGSWCAVALCWSSGEQRVRRSLGAGRGWNKLTSLNSLPGVGIKARARDSWVNSVCL
jgi:hypothetical protein